MKKRGRQGIIKETCIQLWRKVSNEVMEPYNNRSVESLFSYLCYQINIRRKKITSKGYANKT